MHIMRKLITGIVIIMTLISGKRILTKELEQYERQIQYHQLTEEVRTDNLKPFKTTAASHNNADTKDSPTINFSYLKKKNPDTVAWICIPGTSVDYPVVQTTDNDTYLHQNFFGEESREGAIYLDFQTSPTLDGRNNVIYGHCMKDGSMFHDIERFKEPEYFKGHQYFQLYTPGRVIHLKAVSCYFFENTPAIRRARFEDEDAYQSFVKEMLSPCPFAEIPEEPIQSLYTLVTCSYETEDARTVLFAIEIANTK